MVVRRFNADGICYERSEVFGVVKEEVIKDVLEYMYRDRIIQSSDDNWNIDIA